MEKITMIEKLLDLLCSECSIILEEMELNYAMEQQGFIDEEEYIAISKLATEAFSRVDTKRMIIAEMLNDIIAKDNTAKNSDEDE